MALPKTYELEESFNATWALFYLRRANCKMPLRCWKSVAKCETFVRSVHSELYIIAKA